MNAEERAEKVYNEYGRKGSWNLFDKKMIDAIAAQITEAEREAYKRGEDSQKSCEKSFAEGFRAAKEKAARICDEDYYTAGQRIRIMEPDK